MLLPLSASSRWTSSSLPPGPASSSPSLGGRRSADRLSGETTFVNTETSHNHKTDANVRDPTELAGFYCGRNSTGSHLIQTNVWICIKTKKKNQCHFWLQPQHQHFCDTFCFQLLISRTCSSGNICTSWPQHHPPCLMLSTSPSDRKLSSACEMASRSAPAWLERPPPLTLPSRSKRPSAPTNCSGNMSCSLTASAGQGVCQRVCVSVCVCETAHLSCRTGK